ncbi:MAG: hypothetical protein JO138_27470 [Acidobacteriaceae bacterium]|nr:hypothetical protein [Acidobacteriaceae bacterium]
MLKAGDWVTPHLDGIKYFEKSLHNCRVNNLEYGANAPEAPDVFNDSELSQMWKKSQRFT